MKFEGFYLRHHFRQVEAGSPVEAAEIFYRRLRGEAPASCYVKAWSPKEQPQSFEVSCGGRSGDALIVVRNVEEET